MAKASVPTNATKEPDAADEARLITKKDISIAS